MRPVGPCPEMLDTDFLELPVPPCIGEFLFEGGTVIGHMDEEDGTNKPITKADVLKENFSMLKGLAGDARALLLHSGDDNQAYKELRARCLMHLGDAKHEVDYIAQDYKLISAGLFSPYARVVDLRSARGAALTPAQGKALICEKMAAMDRVIEKLRQYKSIIRDRERERDLYTYLCSERRRYGIDVHSFISSTDIESIPIRVGRKIIKVAPNAPRDDIERQIQETLDSEEVSLYEISSSTTMDDVKAFVAGTYQPKTVPRQPLRVLDLSQYGGVLPPFFPMTLVNALRHRPAALQQLFKWAEMRDRFIKSSMEEGEVFVETVGYSVTQLRITIGDDIYRCVLKGEKVDVGRVRVMPSGVFVGVKGDCQELKQRLIDAVLERNVIEII